jgi:membrane protease YdiL (CAAX protease family)
VTPTLFDHVLVLAFGVGVPAYAALVQAPRLRRLPPALLPAARRRAYVVIVAHHWALTAALLWHWTDQGRPLSELGLTAPAGAGFWVGLALVIGLLGLLTWQRRRIYADPQAPQQVAEVIEHVGWLLPATPGELRLFMLVSLTAGVCEELYFRGYFLAYLNAYVGWWPACVGVVVWFGLGHVYQGLLGVVQTGVAGAVFLGIRLISGSLWLSMLFHAGFDAHSGVLVQWIKARLGEDATAPS